MTRYLLGRLLRGVLTVFGVMTLAFFLLRLTGDPARLMLAENASADDVAQLSAQLGFDRPILVQYGDFLLSAVRGDLGDSLRQSGPALELVLDRMPATIELAVAAFLVGLVPALIASLVVQVTGWRWLRSTLLWLGSIRQAVPIFVFGILMVLVFAIWLGWFPSMGNRSPLALVLPALTMGTFEFALYLRLLSASLGSQQQAEYVRTAIAKGQGRWDIAFRDMLPNAILPVLAVAGLNFGALLGGAAVAEIVFNWPGVGQLMINAVGTRDFPVVLAGLLVVSAFFVLINLVIDLLHAALDPRVRVS
jgi:peptide/nickel transport system permease protein